MVCGGSETQEELQIAAPFLPEATINPAAPCIEGFCVALVVLENLSAQCLRDFNNIFKSLVEASVVVLVGNLCLVPIDWYHYSSWNGICSVRQLLLSRAHRMLLSRAQGIHCVVLL